MRAVVVTPLDVSADFAHQLRCLRAWGDLGFVALLAGPARDLARVSSDDWPKEAMLEVPLRATALDPRGHTAACVVPLLQQVAQVHPGQPLILTTPGLYPAMRNSEILADWLTQAPVLALCAEQVPLLETVLYSDVSPCRDRFEAFVIAPDRIAPVTQALAQWPVAEEMCLGDGGWDLLLGAVIATPAIGGQMTDSAVLLREGAGVSPARGAALKPYVAALRKLDLAEAPDTFSVAQEAAENITSACKIHAEHTARMRAFYFAPAPVQSDLPQAARDCAVHLQRLVPWVRWNYDLDMLTALASRIMGAVPLSADQILRSLNTGPNLGHQTSEALLAMMLWAMCRPEAATGLRPDFSGTPALAQEHRNTLLGLQARHGDDLGALRHALVTQIARDMIDHGVWSAPMHDATAHACQNETDRLLFDSLTACTRKVAHAA